MNEKKICPLLSITSAAVGLTTAPAMCAGDRCAFCTHIHIYGDKYVESCAFKDMADSLDTIAGNG